MSFRSPNKGSNCEGKISAYTKTSGPYKQCGNFKSMFFSFSLYSLLLMDEGGWFKLLRKRKFRELKTADEHCCKNMLQKQAKLNKQAANKEEGFDMERDKIQSLHMNIVNMTVVEIFG